MLFIDPPLMTQNLIKYAAITSSFSFFISDQEEADMRRKYPTAAAGRNALLEKRLSRGGQKFFDSGDYNMIKAAMDPKHKNKVWLKQRR